MRDLKFNTCGNCSFEFPENAEYCPECGIPVIKLPEEDDKYFICPVCESKNPIGERKCAYCCSLF